MLYCPLGPMRSWCATSVISTVYVEEDIAVYSE